MIAALYVDPKGPYFGRADVDPWSETRDARLYAGPHPVVAHPPCSTWGKLAPVNQARYGHRIGSDGGCFEAALLAVLSWGGVLEHPAGSRAWAMFGLPKPPASGWGRSMFGPGWVAEVSQAAYGHRAEKMTWLYFVGRGEPAQMDWSRPEATAVVSFLSNNGGRNLPRLRGRASKATPRAFADALIALAESAA